jgi:hypothetical protein
MLDRGYIHVTAHYPSTSPSVTLSATLARLAASFLALLPITLASYGLCPHPRAKAAAMPPALGIVDHATSVLGVGLGCTWSSSSPAPTRSSWSLPPPLRHSGHNPWTMVCVRCRGWSPICSHYVCCRFGATFIGDDGQETSGPGRHFGGKQVADWLRLFQGEEGKLRGLKGGGGSVATVRCL